MAKDSNLSIGDRAGAAKDAAGNKLDESKHNVMLSVYLSFCPVVLTLRSSRPSPKATRTLRFSLNYVSRAIGSNFRGSQHTSE